MTTADFTPIFEGLTDRERVMVEARLKGMSIPQAAVAAGMSLNNARVLCDEPRVKAALKEGRRISAEACAITREKLTDMLMEAYRAAGCAAEMVMAVRELAKLHGLNAPQQVQIAHEHRLSNTAADLKQLPLAELERLARTHGSDVIEGEFTALPRRLAHAETS